MADERALRDAFGCFATGVTIVTSADAEGRPVGFTANSFTSVSLDPPQLLVCVAKTASSLPAIRAHRLFGVSVLADSQRALAERFARRGVDRFAAGHWVEAESGVLLLEGACAHFACRLDLEVDSGDHVILVGRIDSFRAAPDREPLLYLRGRYVRAEAGARSATTSPASASAAPATDGPVQR
ncbi:MAG: flavin reductase family protein [Sphingomonadaceae bacterium]|uniref:flavin reductase family protein n=1 Tax=Thermaurantiacus sp. TaxID=2820283 RepID=UPI00298ED924|nr:flavin reductase family protein [Thermaurantiacus sp.]MCS6987402.1 flavin reductase family protein [Sphingomonadaceae bacterium]MDW8415322.1 flavin reductase family protein [Thermaurantiacus sp.]